MCRTNRRRSALIALILAVLAATGIAGAPAASATRKRSDTTLELTRFGIGDLRRGTPGATEARLIELLGEPDQRYVHSSDRPCEGPDRQTTGLRSTITKSLRWGDLFTSFNAEGGFEGYVYGPPRTGRPRAEGPGGITLGMLAYDLPDDLVIQYRRHHEHGGVPWYVPGPVPRFVGYVTAPGPEGEVTKMHAGASCFGLAAVDPPDDDGGTVCWPWWPWLMGLGSG
jgi:hypothetical protein